CFYAQVVDVIVKVIRRVGRLTLTLAIIVYDKVACQTHQPTGELPQTGVILIQRPVDPDEYFLSQILSRLVPVSKSVCKIIDTPRVEPDYLLPSSRIPLPALDYQLCLIQCNQLYVQS
ncbi:MAG: hypothetical protein QW828_07820, partial [Candidatus Bathyarchaeia archaeon]